MLIALATMAGAVITVVVGVLVYVILLAIVKAIGSLVVGTASLVYLICVWPFRIIDRLATPPIQLFPIKKGLGKCAICLERLSTVIFIPCYHCCLCEFCSTKHKALRCPICNKNSVDKKKIYYS